MTRKGWIRRKKNKKQPTVLLGYQFMNYSSYTKRKIIYFRKEYLMLYSRRRWKMDSKTGVQILKEVVYISQTSIWFLSLMSYQTLWFI